MIASTITVALVFTRSRLVTTAEPARPPKPKHSTMINTSYPQKAFDTFGPNETLTGLNEQLNGGVA